VGVTQFAANRSSTNLVDAVKFAPERWMDEPDSIYKNDERDVVHPFSNGGRDCLGQNFALTEFRIILAKMIWNFNIFPVSELLWEDQKAYMLWKKEPFLVRLVAREIYV
jgi:cytochrome P450